MCMCVGYQLRYLVASRVITYVTQEVCDRITQVFFIRYSGTVHIKAYYAFLWYTAVMVHCLASSPSHIPKNSGGGRGYTLVL